MSDPFFQPVSGFDLPRFAGVPTFMRLPHLPQGDARWADVDVGLIGIPWDQAGAAGGLFGTKIVLNEFVAFIELGTIGPEVLTERSRAIITFALCGFANFSSIAIQMAVTGGLAPNQRPVIAKLGLRALAAGSLANLMSAALAGLLLPY